MQNYLGMRTIPSVLLLLVLLFSFSKGEEEPEAKVLLFKVGDQPTLMLS